MLVVCGETIGSCLRELCQSAVLGRRPRDTSILLSAFASARGRPPYGCGRATHIRNGGAVKQTEIVASRARGVSTSGSGSSTTNARCQREDTAISHMHMHTIDTFTQQHSPACMRAF